MTEYEYIGNNDHYLDGGDRKLEPGDVVDFEDGPSESFADLFRAVEDEKGSEGAESDSVDEEDESPSADEESAQNDAEPDQSDDEPPFDPSDLTISELEEKLEEENYSDEELDAILQAERGGNDREGAKNELTDRLV